MSFRWGWQKQINANFVKSIDAHQKHLRLLGDRISVLEQSLASERDTGSWSAPAGYSQADAQLLLNEAKRLLDLAQVPSVAYGSQEREEWLADYQSWSNELEQHNARVGWTREKGFTK